MDELDYPDAVRLLGGFVVAARGAALRGISTDSQRLLAFLALCQREVTRNELAAALWPQSAGEHADARLGQAVSHLDDPVRKAVKVTEVELRLAEGVVVDVHHFRPLAQG